MSNLRCQSEANELETTAIDSGTIWTTERFERSRPEGRRRSISPARGTQPSSYYAHASSADSRKALAGGFDAPRGYNIPRASYDPERQKTEASDEFRFLEDRPTFPKLSRFYYRRKFSFTYRKPIFVTLAILQIFLAVCIFIFAIIRYIRVFNNSKVDLLLDFLKAEDFATSNNEGTAIVSMKVGSAALVPCVLQLAAGVSGLYPLYERPPSFVIVLNLILSCLTLVYWFEPIILIVFELNLRCVQLQALQDSGNYRLLIAVLVILSVLLVTLNAAVVVHSSSQLVKPHETRSSLFDLHVNMVTVVFAAVVVSFSIYTTSHSMSNVALWPNFGLRNQAALYGLGLRELLVSVFVLLTALFGSFTAIVKNKSLRLGSLALQLVAILLILQHLLTGDRILAVAHNVDKMFSGSVTVPFTPEILLLTYIFVLLMTVSVLVQLLPTSLNVFRRRAYEYYESSYAVPRPAPLTPQIQRSAF